MINLITLVRLAVECPAGEDAGKTMSNQTGRNREQNTSVSSGKRKQRAFVFLSYIPLRIFSLQNTEQTPSCKQTQKENSKSDRT